MNLIIRQDVMRIGLLAVSGLCAERTPAQEHAREETQKRLRAAYGEMDRPALKALFPMSAYVGYYKRFGYTYHVLLQAEGVAKGKEIPDALPAVAAMYLSELQNALLTAGHDLDLVAGELTTARADGTEEYAAPGGRMARAVAGDVLIRDEADVLSSILRGPDARTAITGSTRRALYTVYAPPEIPEETVLLHLRTIAAHAQAFCPGAETELISVY